MTRAIDTHCETVLDSPYSRDRRAAMRELGRAFSDTDSASREQILETLREVAHESSAREDRRLARETLEDCFDEDAATATPVVVDTFCTLATSSKFSDERLEAMDALRDIYPEVSDQHREKIGAELADIAGNATYEDERRRARRRLSDISRTEREEQTDTTEAHPTAGAVSYLGSSLAEHLEHAAQEGSEACLQRAEELAEFVSEHPVDDEAYEDVSDDIESLTEQLSVVPTGETLDGDRIERVERVAARVERLYKRT